MNAFTLSLALLMGLTGSLHCAGMCGPIIWIMPFQFLSGLKKWFGIFLYHFGRITAYALLALCLHSFRSIFHPELQQYVSITLGVLLLAVGILSFFPYSSLRINLPWTGYVRQHLGGLLAKPGVAALLFAGFFNGLLPCGLVYMALSASVNVNSVWQAVGLMYAFGTGTLPMLVSITLLRNRFPLSRFQSMKKMVPLITFFFGCVFIVRGMGLSIPYLSPKIEVTQHSVISSCCHKH